RRERPEHQENRNGADKSTQTRLGMRKRGSSYLPSSIVKDDNKTSSSRKRKNPPKISTGLSAV
ncbi:hypothetical protein ACQZ46_18110, partial [Agrobacterium salinitolerans]